MSRTGLSDHYARGWRLRCNYRGKTGSVSRVEGSSTVIIHRENTVTPSANASERRTSERAASASRGSQLGSTPGRQIESPRLGTNAAAGWEPLSETAALSHVWTAPLRQVLIWHGDDCGRDAVMCLACLVQPFSRLLALMCFARWVLIKFMGSTPVARRRFPPRRPTDRHHAISTSAIRIALRRVPLALAMQSCAA